MEGCELRYDQAIEQAIEPAMPPDLTVPPASKPPETPGSAAPCGCSAALPPGSFAQPPERAKPEDLTAPPCFFASVCKQRASVEKTGRSVCRGCAKRRLRGVEYPLRATASEPLYLTGRAASEALDMIEEGSRQARRGLRGGIWS